MITTILLVLLAIILFPITIVSAIVWVCWNALTPEILPLVEISFWQSFGLCILIAVIAGLIRGAK